jgi:hypothetical protein
MPCPLVPATPHIEASGGVGARAQAAVRPCSAPRVARLRGALWRSGGFCAARGGSAQRHGRVPGQKSHTCAADSAARAVVSAQLPQLRS